MLPEQPPPGNPKSGQVSLRPYQQTAVDTAWKTLYEPGSSGLIVVPTGGGKSLVIAALAANASNQGWRVIILAHVGELLVQLESAVHRYAPWLQVGVVSAGLGRREIDRPVTIASIQTFANCVSDAGQFDLVLIDEAHRTGDEESRYGQTLAALKSKNSSVRICGLSATPFRSDIGKIAPSQWFASVMHEVEIRPLIESGFLSQISTKLKPGFRMKNLRLRAGEFSTESQAKEFGDDEKLSLAIDEIIEQTSDRNRVLIFGVGVQHLFDIQTKLKDRGHQCAIVHGGLSQDEREAAIQGFKFGQVKFLANCAVLCEGFDDPQIDCVVLLRATQSAGLYAQIVGRGLRIHQGKKIAFFWITGITLCDLVQSMTFSNQSQTEKARSQRMVDESAPSASK